mmetsp:Transcript_30270/g.70694  ORF Transcript_30270/g.70694 Transcript_30270/m.70694 type:complete len:440 (+) Transcript_30270:372-1691(+)
MADDDGGLGVVRIKPLGAGGGGVEKSAGFVDAGQGVSFSSERAEITVDGRSFAYPSHVISPQMRQQELFDAFMPPRIRAFMDGTNVNVMAYGQTGSGKTHTVFGPPGIMQRAGAGEYGVSLCPDYGIFPRTLLSVLSIRDGMRAEGLVCTLTGSAVELSLAGNEDMLCRMGSRERQSRGFAWDGAQLGVAIDRASDPPRLYGMTELSLEGEGDVLRLFGALATRNTAGTLLNDSSSRSHCFAWLTMRVYDPTADTVRTSRFQFADLAGSERLDQAHGGDAAARGLGGEDMQATAGLMTNYSLMMLSTCARQLTQARRSKGGGKGFSFRAYMVDLVQLLQESMSGDASTACFVCLSQAPANLTQSKFSLDFGEVFSRLSTQPKRRRPQHRAALARSASKLLLQAEDVLKSGGGGKYRVMREAQAFDCRQQLAILKALCGK